MFKYLIIFYINISILLALNLKEESSTFIIKSNNEEQEFKSFDLSDFSNNNNYFTNSLSSFKEYIVISSVGYDNNRGKVFIFKKMNTNIKLIKVLKNKNSPNSFYGSKVDIHNNIILISAIGEQKVYIYKIDRNDRIKYINTIKAKDKEEVFFGTDIKVYNNYIAIGSPSSINGGSAYLYSIDSDNSISLIQKIMSPQKDYGSFAYSLGLNNNKLIISSSKRNNGKVYIYNISENKINLSQIIKAMYPNEETYFAKKIFLSKNYLLISSQNGNKGDLYIYNSNKKIEYLTKLSSLKKYEIDLTKNINIKDNVFSFVSKDKTIHLYSIDEFYKNIIKIATLSNIKSSIILNSYLTSTKDILLSSIKNGNGKLYYLNNTILDYTN